MALALSACQFSLGGDDKGDGGGDKAQPPDEVRKNSVDVAALWFAQDPSGTASGGTSPVEITVEPSEDDEFKIAFVEDEVLGSGDQWRASQWTGSAVALMATGTNPEDVAIEFAVDGRIDGPSAGALMTVGVAAALNGDKIDPDVTMTGTINPDGSIGPVGGIPQKVQGAAEAGKKTVLIPVGKRESEDKATGQMVDVVALGEDLDVEVREVANVFDAYEEFTGEEMTALPEPVKNVRLEDEISSRLEGVTENWLDIYAGLATMGGQLDPTLKAQQGLDQVEQVAADYAGLAEDQLDDGLPAAAFDAAMYAAFLQLRVDLVGSGLGILATEGVDALKAFLEENSTVDEDLEFSLEELLEKKPDNVSDVAALANSYAFAVDGLGVAKTAEQVLSTENVSVDDVTEAIGLQAQSITFAAVSEDMLDIGLGLDSRSLSESVDPEKIADFFDRAADANMALFESVVIPQLTQVLGVPDIQARLFLQLKFPTYGAVVNSDLVIQEMEKEAESVPKAASLDYARLGAAMSRYVNAAGLIARFYSLDVEADPENFGVIQGFGSTDQLQAMFEVADEQTRRGIAALEDAEIDPSPIGMLYEMAVFEAGEEDPESQLTALGTLWTAQLQSQILLSF